jgi:5,5'-dehydrodivanillate O-demethylase oxygenase subunit
MLSQAENEFLTRVGPGTPAGALLRRYWHPIAVAKELTPEQPTKFVRVLGEDLVLFLDKSGRVGLLADHCSHRSASLLYGRVEERGIACAYHGWLYDTEGNILETPPERNGAIMKSVKQPAYPVQRFLGLLWAYLGPQPAPLLPRYDTLMRQDGRREIHIHPQLDCNWLQAMENSVDPAHLQILHQEFSAARHGGPPASTTRGFTDDVESFEFYKLPYGIMKKRQYTNGMLDEHPLIFPNILRQGPSTQIRVPIDDEHTYHVHVMFYPSADGSEVQESDPPITYIEPYKSPAEKLHPFARFDNRSILAQDHMAWETQGPLADRTKEHLSYSDRGVVLLRRLLKEQIEQVQMGLDPICVFRDPAEPLINTNVDEGVRQMSQSRGAGAASRQR